MSHRSANYRRQVTGTASASGSTSSSFGSVSPEDIIQQAENHWDVSATSILVAWIATLIGILSFLLLYSALRLRWKRIYLPRLKLRKPSRPIKEKNEDKIKMAKMDTATKKAYISKKFLEEPDYYPKGENDDGLWISRAPKAAISVFGWLRPSWEETKLECRSMLPHWFTWCWSFMKSLLGDEGKKNASNRPTILEQDVHLLKMIGLDGVLYLMFLRLLKYLFSSISIFAILLAFANYYINTETIYGSTNASTSSNQNNSTIDSSSIDDKANVTNIVDNPNLLTAVNVKSNGLLVHISFEIMVTLLVIIFVLKASAHHLRLVEEWAKMNYNEISFKTLFVTRLALEPREVSSNGEAKDRIRNICLSSTEIDDRNCKVWFAIHAMNPLEERIEKFKRKAFSRALNAVAIETFYKGHESQRGLLYDNCWQRLTGKTKKAETRVREALREKEQIEKVQSEIRQEQESSDWLPLKGTITAAFVTFSIAKEAREVLKNRKKELKKAGYHVEKAPRTHNVLWKNLEKDAKSRRSHVIMGKFALVVVCAFQVMFILFFTNIVRGIDRYPKLAKMQKDSEFWKGIFNILKGALPAIVAALFSLLLPYILRILNRWSGAFTRGQLDKDQIRQLFIFLVVSNFIVFSLLGVLYESIAQILRNKNADSLAERYKSLGDLPAKITKAYISQSLYWLSWYPIRSLVMWLQLLQLPRILVKIPQLIKFKTPQDLAEVTLADSFEVTIEYSWIIFTMVVGLMYAPLAPIVVIGATLHFWSAHIVHSESLKFVNDVKETDGECWYVVINRLLVATVLMHCLMVLTVLLKTQSSAMSITAGLPILFIVLLKIYLNKHYDSDHTIYPHHLDGNSDNPKSKGVVESYQPDVLRVDWMPKGKTVRNKKLMIKAKQNFPGLKDLMKIKNRPVDDPIEGWYDRWRKT
ncbi:uncharacterized protein IL334_003886 [Kwoniella shivajii]|uniref:CSC1/OSCA1-like 7TM region domain-containing protein n=1 Tax=Kwoniella shivajii TaxID=564305 RepID=A0ABZ1D1U6_9TREE|nr:hypothetical protein IL334_003886 [Kwoniella shivajii]